ncbi:MAG: MarR family winged helix-turn-helix transcriptional regulator [Terriglobales bacterium]
MTKKALARRAWRLMFDFLMRTAPQRTRSLKRRGLTPNVARALVSLDPREGRSMRSLAEEWECPACNATWIVDRLELLGLAERRTLPHDHRVKRVVLTRKGVRTKTDLMEEFHTPAGEFLELDRDDLEALQRALEKLLPACAPPPRR